MNKPPIEIYNDYNFSKIIVRDLFGDDISKLINDKDNPMELLSYKLKGTIPVVYGSENFIYYLLSSIFIEIFFR